MKRSFQGALVALALIISTPGDSHAQTLSAGDIAIVGVNSWEKDEFAFLALVDLLPGTEIRFTDHGWPFIEVWGWGEPPDGELRFTASGLVEKGTVVRMYAGGDGPRFSPSDQLLAYQGSFDNPTFIHAVNFSGNGMWQTDASDPRNSALPPGLQNGTTAVAVYGCANVAYARSLDAARSELLALIGNRANWTCDNARPLDFEILFGNRGYGIPTFAESIPDTTLSVDESFSFTFSAADPDSESLIYSITPDPPTGATFSSSTGSFRWKPSPGQEGTYPFQVSVSDGAHSVEHALEITVVTVVSRLHFTVVPENQVVTGSGSITLRYAAEDPDGEDVELAQWRQSWSWWWSPFDSTITFNHFDLPNVHEVRVQATNSSGDMVYHTTYVVVLGTLLEAQSGDGLYGAIKDQFNPRWTPTFESARSMIFAEMDLRPDNTI